MKNIFQYKNLFEKLRLKLSNLSSEHSFAWKPVLTINHPKVQEKTLLCNQKETSHKKAEKKWQNGKEMRRKT